MLTTQSLDVIIDDISNAYGEDFFKKITASLAKAVKADFCFIATIDNSPPVTASTLAFYAEGKFENNFQYEMDGTPCHAVTHGGVEFYEDQIQSHFPNDRYLVDLDVEAYVGSNLIDSSGSILGIVVAMYHNKIEDPKKIHTLYKLFSGRIAAEIERVQKAAESIEENKLFERQLKRRTLELNNQLNKLRFEQKHLVEQEKYAGLGSLVGGVAHEINTPLGVAIMSTSIIKEEVKDIRRSFDDHSLSKKALSEFLNQLTELSGLLNNNLYKVVDLVSEFKKIAVDQSDMEKSNFCLRDLLDLLLEKSLFSKRNKNIKITNNIPAEIRMDSYVVDFFNLFEQVISNSIMHAFPKDASGNIFIEAEKDADNVHIKVIDDGIGVDEENQKKAFDPFFTTQRAKGKTGLGLNIVYNIVNQKLKGSIHLVSTQNEGTEVSIFIPVAE